MNPSDNLANIPNPPDPAIEPIPQDANQPSNKTLDAPKETSVAKAALKMMIIHLLVVIAIVGISLVTGLIQGVILGFLSIVIIPVLVILIAKRLRVIEKHVIRIVIITWIGIGVFGMFLSTIKNTALLLASIILLTYLVYYLQIKGLSKAK